MMSNKWAFSLTSLITIFAFAFVASTAMAGFDIKLNADDQDVSFADGIQVPYGEAVEIKVTSPEVVNLGTQTTTAEDGTGALEILPDFTIVSYNAFGGTVFATGTIEGAFNTLGVETVVANGKNFKITVVSVPSPAANASADAIVEKVVITLKADSVDKVDDATNKNTKQTLTLNYVGGTETDADGAGTLNTGQPGVASIMRAGNELRPVTGANFDVIITLTEEARKGEFKKDKIEVSNATAADPVLLDMIPAPTTISTTNLGASGRDGMLYRYVVTITPKYETKDNIVVKVKAFYDQEKMPDERKMYEPPILETSYKEGMDKLTVKVGKEDPPDKTAGIEVKLLNEGIIPKDGYLVVAKDRASSAVRDPSATADGDDPKEVPSTTNRQPFGQTYNIVAGGDNLPNLETFLTNGGTIDLVVSAEGASTGDLVISEIMWGSDASINPDSFKSQYIEIRNTSGSQVTMGDGDHKLVFYPAGAPLPDMSVAAKNIQDRVGTVGASGYWSVAGKGQSGRTGVEEAPGDVVAVTPTQALISMQRVIDAAGVAADGTLASSWAASSPPGVNFDPNKEGIRIGSPGRAPESYPVAPTPEPEPTPAPVVPVAEAEDIMITEIMVDTGGGRLPQWIELTNVSGAEVSLAGWSLMISNAKADTDAIGASVDIKLSGTLGVGGGTNAGGTLGKSLLIVSRDHRSSSNLEGSTRVMDISGDVGGRGSYKLISDMAFMIALVPPQKTGVLTYGDTAGNLDATEAWEIPMAETGRSSLIRRETDYKPETPGHIPSKNFSGTSATGWVLASGTSLVSGPATWYGSDEDAGTPGYDAGGPLPVELSHFRPARDKQTGAVVITWATQSELNNAGFFIKRSNQRNGQFEVVNPTMIPGAGTTSEKQFYTYTDTTAQPNVVYYYQIEDVSLDGNRQTLTRGIRLKGHIGAAGKATTLWGELKSSNE